jgi:hypothetical protein
MKVEIVEAKRRHCGLMARMMRVEHDAALRRRGINLHRAIREKFAESHYCRAAFVDGHIAGMWGLCGSPLASDGMVWLVVAQHVLKHRRKIVELARAELVKMAEGKRYLGAAIIPEDEAACRFASFMGFSLVEVSHNNGGPIPMIYLTERGARWT